MERNVAGKRRTGNTHKKKRNAPFFSGRVSLDYKFLSLFLLLLHSSFILSFPYASYSSFQYTVSLFFLYSISLPNLLYRKYLVSLCLYHLFLLLLPFRLSSAHPLQSFSIPFHCSSSIPCLCPIFSTANVLLVCVSIISSSFLFILLSSGLFPAHPLRPFNIPSHCWSSIPFLCPIFFTANISLVFIVSSYFLFILLSSLFVSAHPLQAFNISLYCSSPLLFLYLTVFATKISLDLLSTLFILKSFCLLSTHCFQPLH